MKIVIFVLTIALTVGAVVKELGTTFHSEGTYAQSERAKEEKIARDDENSGTCGDNLSWVFNDETSSLTISGQGNMTCCNSSYTPWSQFSNQVQNIEIQEGVSSIDKNAFYNFFQFEDYNYHIKYHINRKICFS